LTYLAGIQQDTKTKESSCSIAFEYRILQHCCTLGFQAAATDPPPPLETPNPSSPQETIIRELQAHFHLSFGHPIRLDFGTGHESCFFIFLLCLFKLGIFGYNNNNKSSSLNPSPDIMAPVALSITTQYLQVCRGLQVEYMLEPAGSHGVWGLDDYHCLPFYIGACQLQDPTKYYSSSSTALGSIIQQVGEIKPSIIHKEEVLQSDLASVFMYLGCIRFVKSLKSNVPFFESSPMLNDISHLQDWVKVSSGLLRLYEGDVLDRISVVQHFVFGDLFKGMYCTVSHHKMRPFHFSV